jgi:hypothetical protein
LAWSFDFPRLASPGPTGQLRFAPATILTLGDLMLWVVAPVVEAAVAVPEGVVSCGPRLRPKDLSPFGHALRVDEEVSVTFAPGAFDGLSD